MPDKTEADFDIYVRLLSKKEIARFLGKSPRTIDNLMKSRAIPHVKLGRSVGFRLRDVERALAKLTVNEVSL